jgi:DNA-binding MltR family transcriptional regulator
MSRIKKLSRDEPSLGDVLFLIDYLDRVDDRIVTIIATTRLEDALENAITSKMVDLSQSDYAELFRGDQPLATYSAKIKLAFALGLIGKQTRSELNTIRLIRNAFAHCRKAIWFSTDEVAEACSRLTIPERTDRLAEFKGIKQPIESPRERFVAATLLYTGALTRYHWPALYQMDPVSAPLD